MVTAMTDTPLKTATTMTVSGRKRPSSQEEGMEESLGEFCGIDNQ